MLHAPQVPDGQNTPHAPPPLPPDIALTYRVNDAAKVAGLPRSTIYALIAEKRLRSIMVAGRRLIPSKALRELLEGPA